MNAIETHNLSKSYGKAKALCGVSLTVERGELFGLIGPDGSGKTTLMRILATLIVPDGGNATVEGFDTVSRMTDIRRRVGYMPGRFSLYQDLTVEENLQFFATLFGTTIAQGYDNIRAVYAPLEPFRRRRAGALSGGMKQKLALSCALIHNPTTLLLDEPTTGIDPVARRELWDTLARLRSEGMTIVVSTPYLDEIRRCDRVAYLQEGRLLGTGRPDDVLRRFADVFCPPPLSDTAGHCASGDEAIAVEHLVKAFGQFRAVDDISFTVRRGEIFGFLGANGAGKTTAMRVLTGLSRPTSGRARVAGYDVTEQPEQVKRHIGYMSQRFSLYEDLTPRENIRLFAGIYGLPDGTIRAKTDAMLASLGMESVANEPVSRLPPGWKQRLAFSVSIVHDPSVVFLDEPTGGVDPATRRHFWQLIREAAGRGITVFVTTHYMDEADYCDRISIMVDGRISAIGTPTELKRRYNQPDMDSLFTYLARKAKRQ